MKYLVSFSDPHFGASTGLLPPKFVSFEGQIIKQNPFQIWQWMKWKECWKWVKSIVKDEEYGVAANGDLIDGNHHNTREIISPNVQDHVEACVQGLAPFLVDAKSVFITEGTNVHTNNSEHGIAGTLRSMGINVVKPNKRKSAWSALSLRVHGCLTAIDHHMSTALSSLSESAAFSRTMGDITYKTERAGYNVPKVIIRSHRHQFGMYDDGYKLMISLPPWQGSSRFVRRVAPGAVPQCGMVILDWTKSPFGGLPVVHRKIFTAPQSNTFL